MLQKKATRKPIHGNDSRLKSKYIDDKITANIGKANDSCLKRLSIKKTIVLIGLMGAGKSSIGRRLAEHLDFTFKDSDEEVELAARLSINEIFANLGEKKFREGERRVISRLLDDKPMVLATGGGAFLDSFTRDKIANNAISIWLKADLPTLVKRTSRRNNRPLLNNKDQKSTLKKLIDDRYPTYKLADITVESNDEAVENTLTKVVDALDNYLAEIK